MSSNENSAGNKHCISAEVIGGFMRGNAVFADIPFEQIHKRLFEGRIAILKNVFDPGLMTDFRHALRRWSAETPQYPHGKSMSLAPDENHHRRDEGVYKSAIAHIFHQYSFNNLDLLPSYIGEPAKSIGHAMLGLQNALAATEFGFSSTGMRFKVIHYPAGAGFLDRHVHQLEPQRVGLILSLARMGADTHLGGTRFQTPFGPVDTSLDHDIGDIIMFRYDIGHEVTLIDEGRALDWASEAGKWSVVLELRENYALSRPI